MPRENAEAKAKRLLAEGRLTVTSVGGFDRHRPDSRTQLQVVKATCRGNGSVYDLGYDGSTWWCTCPALSRRCSHLLALQSVTTPEARARA